MIRFLKDAWFICYESGKCEPFAGPFGTQKIAQRELDGLLPVDRMLVSGQGPFLNTDATFMEGTELTGGKKHLRQLARFRGDPRATVSSRGEVQRICEQDRKICEGMVNVKIEEPEPPKRIAIAEDIVDRETAKMLKGTRGVPAKKKAELREAVRDKISNKG